MPYVTSIERHAEERGREEGREEGSTRILLPILRRICGDLPQETRDRQPKKKTRTLNPFDTMSPEDRAEDEALEDLFHLATNLNRDASEAQRGILERLCEDVNNRLCDLRKSWLSQH